MAYTYDDFLNAANTAGLLKQFSEQDLQTAQRNPEFGLSILSLKKDVANATTPEQRLLANEAANQLRKTYGNYSGGSDGSGYQVQGTNAAQGAGGTGSFSYANQDAYQKLLDSLVNQQPFSYDLEADPVWGSYKKQYTREGDRATANALAQAAAASGGIPSSYAATAAAQAGNYYAGQLTDIIPTLEQNAYGRYLDDFNARLGSLGALESDRAFSYENFMNEYNMQQQELQNQQTQDQLAYENALALYQALGYATPEVAKILGISAGSSYGSGSYGGSSGGSGSGSRRSDSGGGGDETVIDDSDIDAGGDPVVDMNSVLQLGYGPISAERLNELVEDGEIEEYVEGNKIKFRKKQKTSKNPAYDYAKEAKEKARSGGSSGGNGKKNTYHTLN